MELGQSLSMRPEMRTLLTPRMIQSMEILQLPLAALEERIEQEMENNPVLEIREIEPEEPTDGQPAEGEDRREEGETSLVVQDDAKADFDRLDRISEYLENEEYTPPASGHRASNSDGERDKKTDFLNNTVARSENLVDFLLNQWAFIEAPDPVKVAGEVIVNYINPEGYLTTALEDIQKESLKRPVTLEHLQTALQLIQTLDPAGIGARNVRECLLLQLDALEAREEDDNESSGHDFDLERNLVTEHLKDLEMNRYPQISKKLNRPIEQIKTAVKYLGRLHPHPGKQIGHDDAPPITPDARIYLDEETNKYEIEMLNDPAPNLYISAMYRKMLKDRICDKKTREFLSNNVRNARWLLESIEQRKSTILRVIRVVVDAQREFFEKGAEFLRPLPMIQVADMLGIHVATVSRAVSEKWIQTPRGIFPLRRFFSQGTINDEGEEMSWAAVQEKLKIIVANENKSHPFNDDEIVAQLKEQGIDLARRTVAKYRKTLNIATARQRRQF